LHVRFGECGFDSQARELRRGNEAVPLSPKAYQFLEFLLANRPRALSKAEIHDHLWPRIFVSESSLSRLAAELRQALGDDARRPRFIRTVYGFGYAFSGEVVDAPERPAAKYRDAYACRVTCGSRDIVLDRGENVIGRMPDARVWIDTTKVSRRHARIIVSGGRAVIEDLGSKNGTFLNGRKIASAVALADDDEIRLGLMPLTFRVVGGASTKTAKA